MTGGILVTGGNGRLGRTVLSLLGEHGVAGVRRPSEMPGAVLVDANGKVDLPSLNGIAAIINCAGRVTGTTAEIEQANVTYPATLLRHAHAAGIPRFVQVSSFSVFGRVERIENDTPIVPESAYGRSKAEAERMLRALDDADRVVALRLPFLFSAAEPALLGSLVKAMLKARMWPVLPGEPVRRSMITYGSAAEALIALALAADTPQAVQMAADPAPLALATVAAAVHERLGKRVVTLPVPRIAATLAQRIAPGVAERLFRSSVLASEANMLTDGGCRPVLAEVLAYLDRCAA